ncbi:gastrula zinc finger protein 5-1 isoform X2 [Coregonus clupeaformis]|nr:gastrula zinc finger protein 5-1 isoform X2 [Coregonus clupeaformis]
METVLKSAMYEITRLVEDGFLEEVRRGQQEVTRSHQEVESLRTLLQQAESQLKNGSQMARCADCGRTDVYNEETDDRPPGMQDSVLLLSGCDLKQEEEPEVRWRSCGQETVESSQVAAKPTPPTPPAPSPSLVGSVKEEEEGEEDMEPWRMKVDIQPSAAHTYTEEQRDSHTLGQSTGDSIGFLSADPEAQHVTQTPRPAGPSQNQSRGPSNDGDGTRSRASPVWISHRILDTDTDVHRRAQSNLRLVREPLSSSESAEAKQQARDLAPPANPSTAGASVSSSSSSGSHVFSSLNYRIPSKYKPSPQALPRMRVYRDAAKRGGYIMYNRGTAQGGLTPSQTPTQQQGNNHHQHHHPGRMALRCPVCGKVFPHPSSLKAHEQTHTGERPFVCALCGRSFTKLSNLKAHRRVHTGERPYSCSDCGKRFTQKCNLKRHQRIHMENDI